jgi:hypothetical protein
MRTARPTHGIVLHLTTLIKLGEEYRLHGTKVCGGLHIPATASAISPNASLSILQHANSTQLPKYTDTRFALSYNKM